MILSVGTSLLRQRFFHSVRIFYINKYIEGLQVKLTPLSEKNFSQKSIVSERQFMTSTPYKSNESGAKDMKRNNEEWSKKLTPEQYSVCRLNGTEPPFSGQYYDHWLPGSYVCVCCKTPLFSSESKFNSGCGWPAFSSSIEANVTQQEDLTHGMVRTEVRCSSCNSHLGHVFDDGPPPTGKRYCINSVCLEFVPKQ